jgi:hypothetical protein
VPFFLSLVSLARVEFLASGEGWHGRSGGERDNSSVGRPTYWARARAYIKVSLLLLHVFYYGS